MHVSGFMVPAEKVFTCTSTDTIDHVLDIVVNKGVSAVVVMDRYQEALGLVTSSNLTAAYKNGIPVTHAVSEIMVKQPHLDTILDTDSRDTAAKMLETCGRHHAVVVNAQGHFVGLVSSWDVVAEVAKDARAWPWMRTDDGKVHPPISKTSPTASPKSASTSQVH